MGNASSLKIKKKVKAMIRHNQNPSNDETIEEMLCTAILDENVLALQELIDQGANLNYPCQDEYFPLAFACYFGNYGKGHLKTVKVLVENGAELESLDRNNMTPLMLAMANRCNEIVEYLISKGANVNHRIPLTNNLEGSPLAYAVNFGLSDFAKVLLNNGAKVNSLHLGRPLIYKALDGELFFDEEALAIADLMIEKGADINATDSNGMTPIFYAAYEGEFKTMKFLINRGANVNAEIPYKQARLTPLMIAVIKDAIGHVKLLVANGANVNYKTFNKTVLGCAISRSHLEIAKILIDHGASVEDQHDGKNLIDIAVEQENYDLVKLLIAQGAEFTPESYYESLLLKGHLEMVKYFIQLESNNHIQNNDIDIPDVMFIFCMKPRNKWDKEASERIVDFLIRDGFEINKERGISALHMAILMEQNEIAKELVKRGSDVNVQEDDNDTPLHLAVINRSSELCKMLLDNGANYEVRGARNLTPLDIAKFLKLDEIIDLIIEKMTPEKPKSSAQDGIKIDDCVICYAPRKELFIFHPCGHAKTCERCALKVMHKSETYPTCPICRTNIKELKKVFL